MFFFLNLLSSHEQKKNHHLRRRKLSECIYYCNRSSFASRIFIINDFHCKTTHSHTLARARALNCCIEFARYCKYASVIFDHDHHHHHTTPLCAAVQHIRTHKLFVNRCARNFERMRARGARNVVCCDAMYVHKRFSLIL